MTVDALNAPGTTAAPPPPPGDGRRGFHRRHPFLTALYAVLGFVGLLILALVIFLWLANWNMLRGPIGRYASAQTHRHVELDGDLKVHLLTWTPTVTINGLKIGNPSWAGPGDMADIDRLIISVRFWPLLTGRVVMPLFELDKPNVSLLADLQGRHNWDLGATPKPDAKPFRLPPIERFVVDDGRLKYVDLKRRMSIVGTVDSNERATDASAHAFALKGQGEVNRKPFLLRITGGPLLHVQLDKPYPFAADVRAGDTHITAQGQLAKPFDMNHFTTNLHLSGGDLAEVYYLTGLALPNTPPYDIKGVVTHKGREYDFDKGVGRVGDSDIEGNLKVLLSEKNRPNVTANLSSRLLDFKDLATLFGAKPVTKAEVAALAKPRPVKIAIDTAPTPAAATPASQRLLPDSTLATERLRGMDATLHYHAAAVKSAFLPLRQATLDLNLDHGVLAVDPVSFDFPQGRFWAQARLDARGQVPVTDADMRLSNVNIQEFLPKSMSAEPPIEGTLAARVKLKGAGDSVHKAAAASNGAVTVVIPQGKLRAAFAELLGVDAGKGLGLLLSKNQGQTNIRCAVADFAVRNGVLEAQDIVFDTDVVRVNGKGDINLGDESVDLTLKGDPKRFRITHLLLPVSIKGHLRQPQFGVKPASTIAQGGVAAVLGFLFPPAAILPFVDPGLAKNADCQGLMSQAQAAPASIKASQAHGLKTTPTGVK